MLRLSLEPGKDLRARAADLRRMVGESDATPNTGP